MVVLSDLLLSGQVKEEIGWGRSLEKIEKRPKKGVQFNHFYLFYRRSPCQYQWRY